MSRQRAKGKLMNLWVIQENENAHKKWKIEPKSHPWLIGSTKEAQLRVVREGQPEVLGSLDFNEEKWQFTNLCPPIPETNVQRVISIDGPTQIEVSGLKLKVIPLTEKPEILPAEERKKLLEFKNIQNSLAELKKLRFHHFFEKDTVPFLGTALAISLLLIITVSITSRTLDETKKNLAQDPNQITRVVELQKFPVKSKALTKAMKNIEAPKHKPPSPVTTVAQSKKIIGSIFSKIQSKSLMKALKNVTISAQSKNLVAGVLTKNLNQLSKSLPDSKVLSGSPNGQGKGIGPVGINTVGGGGGGGTASYGNMEHGDVGNAQIGIVSEETDVVGGLDREVIAKYIQSQLGPILFCYERQLSANPGLFGKVAIKFQIKGDGLIEFSQIAETTLKSKSVETCLLNQVNKWKFPKPKGGSNVLVTYPFMFKSVN